MSDIQNVILDTSVGLIHKMKKGTFTCTFYTVIVSGDSVIKIVLELPCVLLFSSLYNLIVKCCSGRNSANDVSAFR